MSAQADPDTVAQEPGAARRDTLTRASPTTTRYVAFLAALLSAGLFAGSWIYNQTQGRQWLKVVVDCAGKALQSTLAERKPLPPARAEAVVTVLQSTCRGEAESVRAVYSLGGVGVAAAAALIIVYIAPVLVRRRRRLTTLGPELQDASDRFAALTAKAELRRPPRLERGPTGQRDAFSYGPPGRPRVVLPPAALVRWRDTDVFDPLVLHELAHVRHRDVALAWLARSTWYALAPLLALPIVVALLSSDRSILGDFAWRAAVLALTALLVSAALLRSREHEADLRAAQTAGAGPVIALLRRIPELGQRDRIRSLLARHPAAAERILVVGQPERVASLTFLDCLTSAFLAALLFPLVVNVLVVMFTGVSRTGLGELVAALLAGPLIGGSVGLGQWRAAIVWHAAGTRPRGGARAALGVAVGLVAGQLTSLAGTASGATGGLSNPGWLAISAVLGFGATVLSAALGQLYADAFPAPRGRRALTATAVVVNGLIFAAAIWVATTLQFVTDSVGVAFAREWLVTVLPSTALARVTVAALALSAAWALWSCGARARTSARQTGRGNPRSRQAGGVRVPHWAVAALTSGVAAEGALAVYHVIAGPAASLPAQAQRYYLYLWVAAAAGAACTVALCRLDPARGGGVACLAAPLATLTAAAGFLVVNTALGGRLSVQFVVTVATAPVALGWLFSLLAAPAGLIPPAPRLKFLRHRRLARWAAPALCAVAIAALLLTGRDAVVGPPSAFQSTSSPASTVVTAAQADGMSYLDTTAPAIVAAYAPAKRAIAAAAAAATRGDALRIIRAGVLPRLRAILDQAESVRLGTPQLVGINSACLAAFQDAIGGYSLLAQELQQYENPRLLAQANRQLRAATAAWTQWQVGLLELTLGAGLPVTPAAFGLNNG